MTIIGKCIQRSVFTLVFVLFASSAWAQSASMDELYKKALKEGGTLNFYGTLAQISADKVLPEFEKRFPGIKINHWMRLPTKWLRGPSPKPAGVKHRRRITDQFGRYGSCVRSKAIGGTRLFLKPRNTPTA